MANTTTIRTLLVNYNAPCNNENDQDSFKKPRGYIIGLLYNEDEEELPDLVSSSSSDEDEDNE